LGKDLHLFSAVCPGRQKAALSVEQGLTFRENAAGVHKDIWDRR